MAPLRSLIGACSNSAWTWEFPAVRFDPALFLMQHRVWTAILIASLGWGTGGVATRAAFDQGLEPYALVTLRSVLAAAAVVAYLAMSQRRLPRDRVVWRLGAVQGITNLALPFVLFTLAYQHASAGFVGLIAALIPITTAGLAHFLLPAEPMRVAKLGGLAVAFVGVAVLAFSGDSGLASGGRPGLALALGTIAVASISLAGVHAKRYAGRYEPVQLTGIQFLVGTPLLAAAMLIVEGVPPTISVGGWGLVLYLAIASSFVPFVLFFWMLRHTTITRASLVGYLVPIIAVISGIVLLSEQLQTGIAVGGALILMGVVLTDRVEAQTVRT